MKIKFHLRKTPDAIALIIVMVTVFVLTALVGAFALSMKVEMKLARNATSETELEWLGRSGVELAKYVLALQLNAPQEQYDSLNQVWAGGPGSALTSNSPLNSISLKDHKLGAGTYSVRIVDLERKFNINASVSSLDILNQAFIMMGVDAGEYPQITSAIQDWVDTDEDEHIGGAETSFYQTLTPPYLAKNGPIDDITELLLIKGITPIMFWGSGSSNAPQVMVAEPQNSFSQTSLSNTVGLVDLFTPISSGYLNLNTISAQTLQLFPGFDANMAGTITELPPFSFLYHFRIRLHLFFSLAHLCCLLIVLRHFVLLFCSHSTLFSWELLSHSILTQRDIDEGFDFLGQTIRKFNGKLIIKPSQKSQEILLDKVRTLINQEGKQLSALGLIRRLNPLLRGWTNYHRHVASSRTFKEVEQQLFELLWRWATRRHAEKSKDWIYRQSFIDRTGCKRPFHAYTTDDEGNPVVCEIFQPNRAPRAPAIRRHIKVIGEANPYDPKWELYFEQRRYRRVADELPRRPKLLTLYTLQKGLCPMCNEPITKETGWNCHHLIWRVFGGGDEMENLMLLHPNCHRQLHNPNFDGQLPRPRRGGACDA